MCHSPPDEAELGDKDLFDLRHMPDDAHDPAEAVDLTSVDLTHTYPNPVDDLHTADEAASSPSNHHAFACSYERCKVAVSRKSDLKRHINAKHTRAKILLCPVKGCFKKQERTRFPRSDKRSAHLRAMHGAHSLSECPEESCLGGEPLTLVELHVHFWSAHRYGRSRNGQLAQVPDWYCPLPRCTIRQTHVGLYEHMLQHINEDDLARLVAAADLLQRKHLRLIISDCGSERVAERGDQYIATLNIRCPVCQLRIADEGAFRQHMIEEHLVEPLQRDHFKLWMAAFKPQEYIQGNSNGIEWQGVYSTTQYETILCPVCGHLRRPTMHGTVFSNHHVDMYRKDLSYLKPHRGQISELYPGFAKGWFWRSVWKDLASPLGRASGGSINATST